MASTLNLKTPGGQMATIGRPLLGLTILLVEDSRYCSEAIRLLCHRSGARLRRADSLRAAHRHLATYRPSVVLVDLGLPDGSGLDMVRELALNRPNTPVILAISGDDPQIAGPLAQRAGADGFIPKPLKNLRAFQDLLLSFFPDRERPRQNNVIPMSRDVEPDDLAMKEDLQHVLSLIETSAAATVPDRETLLYCAQFLKSISEAAADTSLSAAAIRLSQNLGAGMKGRDLIDGVATLLRHRLDVMIDL